MRTLLTVCLICLSLSTWGSAQSLPTLNWKSLPPIPDDLGLAGPIVGVYDDLLVVGGGANFARPVWDNDKEWHATVYVLDLRSSEPVWQRCGRMLAPLAYCACASTPFGIAVIGGNDDQEESKRCWMFKPKRVDKGQLTIDMTKLPDLRQPLAYGQAVWNSNRLIVLSGQTGSELSTAIAGGWQLALTELSWMQIWQPIDNCPGGPRAFAMLTNQPDPKSSDKVILMGGRQQTDGEVRFLNDVWQYDVKERVWAQLARLPVPLAAGGAGPLGDKYVAVLSGDDGSLFSKTAELKDNHPGFAKRTWLFEVANNRWHEAGPSPANQVTTTPVAVGKKLIVATGEVRPRVRTSQVWEVSSP